MNRILAFLRLIAQSKISLLGAAVTTSAILGDIILIIGEIFFFETNPYIGIVVYVVFPSIAIFGLVLIPAGVAWKAKRRGAKTLKEGITALKVRSLKQVLSVVFGLSMLNLVVFASVGYRSIHFMESREFCGVLCHEPMRPEYEAYMRSPHSSIACVDCHVGSGVGWLIKSKLDGTRQLLAMLKSDYSKPIQTPLHNLRPARDVCEVCHRPENFHGNLMKVIQTFESDEQNTRNYTVLNLRVGGGTSEDRKARGIHWHVSEDHFIRYYATDEKRENIVWVEQVNSDGTSRIWRRPGTDSPTEVSDDEGLRRMDCVDCHNRPTHIYMPPDKALNEQLELGAVDPQIPWIRKLAEELITQSYSSEQEARDGIATLPEVYRQRYPEAYEANREQIELAVPALQRIYRLNVHPSMRIEWNTYPSLIGHPTSATSACFRCHDGLLQDAQGATITADCEACHFVLADKERDPIILRFLEDR